LTPRERDVLELLVAGRTNQEIADALFISRRTVATHVEHIFSKLGVSSRATAIRLVMQHQGH
jgi:DNA-binding CsgD family transcriptional regulator